jgi:hypothetical protein
MSKTEKKFVDAVVMRAANNTATRAELERAITLMDDEMKGQNPALFAAMLESRKAGF